MPTRKKTAKEAEKKTVRSHHLSELAPEDSRAFMMQLVNYIMPLCPSCRMQVLGFMCGYAINEIVPQQRVEYLRDLIKASMMGAESWEEMNELHNDETRH